MRENRAQLVAMELALRVDMIVPELLPAARCNGNYWSVGSAAGEPGSSLFIRRKGGKAGRWEDAATGEYGDMLDLIRAVHGLDFKGAMELAADWIGTSKIWPHRSAAPKRPVFVPSPEFNEEDAQRALAANEIWRAAQPIKGTAAEAYLRGRGITLPLPPSLRCHPGLDYWKPGEKRGERATKLGRWPVLIGAVQAPDRTITAIHRIWLEGAQKAPVPKPKLAWGALGNGAIRLAAPGRVLGISGGIETSLSAMQMFSLPVWAAVAESRMGSITLPDIVEHVVIFADHDPKDERETLEHVTRDGEIVTRPNPNFGKRPGEELAKRAAEQFMARGLQVDIEAPEREGDDWNTVLQQKKKEAA